LNLDYTGSNEEKKNDEVEDLYELLKEIKVNEDILKLQNIKKL